MRENKHITDKLRVHFMVLNFTRQCPPLLLAQVDLKQGKSSKSEEGKMIKCWLFWICCRGKKLSCYRTGADFLHEQYKGCMGKRVQRGIGLQTPALARRSMTAESHGKLWSSLAVAGQSGCILTIIINLTMKESVISIRLSTNMCDVALLMI